MAESIVVFGNCQAGSIGQAIQGLPALHHSRYVYVPSFNITPEQVDALLTDEVRKGCTLLFEQVMPHTALDAKYDFPNARRITFASLDLNLFWPLRADEKRFIPEPPVHPFGRYPYGDRVINEILADNLAGDDAWDYYTRRSASLMPRFDRLWMIERERWLGIEKTVDVKMSDLVFPRIRHERLFWTYNHPNRLMLCYFGGRILQAAGLLPPDDERARDLMLQWLTWEFGADYHQPIHPLVGAGFELSWWSSNMLYRRIDVDWSFETFVRNQISWG